MAMSCLTSGVPPGQQEKQADGEEDHCRGAHGDPHQHAARRRSRFRDACGALLAEHGVEM
jgi:hypothetical protein